MSENITEYVYINFSIYKIYLYIYNEHLDFIIMDNYNLCHSVIIRFWVAHFAVGHSVDINLLFRL